VLVAAADLCGQKIVWARRLKFASADFRKPPKFAYLEDQLII
jgi:hypothetical protein